MIAEKMKGMVANSSAIRAMFEEGNRLAGIYGAENVYDFSLGNPNIPAPKALTNAMLCCTGIRTAMQGMRTSERLLHRI